MLIKVLFSTQTDELRHLPNRSTRNQSGGCVRVHPQYAATCSDPSRRFCSVTAVVCRQFSHMTRGVGRVLRLSTLCRFWGKMAAVALLLVPMVHMNWCETGETLEAWWCRLDPQWDSGACVVCHRGVNVTLMPAFVAQMLLIGVVSSLKPACLFVSGIAWLFLGGLDEPFCLLRLVRWCDHSVLHAKIQMSHI